MKQTEAIKVAYAAGFFDGEGSVVIVKRKPRYKDRISLSYSILATISQRDGAIMDWLVGNFGGTVLWKDRKNPTYMWTITHRKAESFLKTILPFVKYKKPQIELALRLQTRLLKTKKGTDGKALQLDVCELEKREKMRLRCSELKHIYNESKYRNKLDNGAAVTTKCNDPEMGSDSLTLQEKQLQEIGRNDQSTLTE